MNEHCICCGQDIDNAEAIHNQGVCCDCLHYGPEHPEDIHQEETEEKE